LKIVKGQVYVNGKPQKEIPGIQYRYLVNINGTTINTTALEKLDITPSEIEGSDSRYIMSLTDGQVKKMDGLKFIQSKERVTYPADYNDPSLFPGDPKFSWNLDNFGPIWILYKRIIDVYEENDLQVKDGAIYINGAPASTYTFKMDYFWMMGDHRYNSLDSRYWGFVPEDHVVGKASFVWLSLDKNKSFLSKIRWNRFFMSVK
jgi:signal peptidase I